MKTALILIALCLVAGSFASNSDVEIAKCDVCQFVAKLAESYVTKDTTKAQVLGLLKRACQFAAGYRAQCEAIIDAKGPAFIDLILKKVNPTLLCQTVKLCDKASADALFALTKLPLGKPEYIDAKLSSTGCTLCTFVVKIIESYLASNSTGTEILKFVEQACALSGPYASQCVDLIEAKGPQIIDYILKKENPEVLCEQLTLCAKPSIQPKFLMKSSNLCPECEFVVQVIEGYVTKNTTEAQIISFLDQACALVPSPYNVECKALVDSQGAKLLQELLKRESPEKVCQQLHLCAKPTPSPAPKSLTVEEYIALAGGFCSECEMIVSLIESYISNNATETQILAFLENACAIAGPYAAQCKTAVQTNGPKLIEWVLKKESPEVFCTQLGFCAAPSPSPKPSVELN